MAARHPFDFVPRAFSYILPIQSAATGVAIYAAVSRYGIGRILSILVIVAAGLQGLFGLYLCAAGPRPGIWNRFMIVPTLTVILGVWGGPIYFFGRSLGQILPTWTNLCQGASSGPSTKSSCGLSKDLVTWSSVGLACSILNCILAGVMIVLYVTSSLKVKAATKPTASYPHYVNYAVPQNQAPMYHASKPAMVSSAYPTAAPSTYPPVSPYSASAALVAPFAAFPADAVSLAPAAAAASTRATTNYYYDPRNRIEVCRRLTQLQQADGSWEVGMELAELVGQWGGREIGGFGSPGGGDGATLATSATLWGLCQVVWTARQEGREREVLSASELSALAATNGDMSWAKESLDRAAAWLVKFPGS